MRVTLIHPPAFLNPTALTALRPSLPLGLAFVAASARNAGHEVTVIDAVGEAPDRVMREGRVAVLGLSIEEIVARLPDELDVVGVSEMFTYQWRHCRRLVDAIKDARPDVLVIGGGEHFTGLPELSLSESKLDLVAMGEGEETIVDVLRRYAEHLEAGGARGVTDQVRVWAHECPGVAYRDAEGAAQIEPRRDRVRDVDGIPLPAWDLFQVLTYDENRFVSGIRKGITVPILATRGCPYRCAYCSSPNMWTTKWIARDPKLVADEIESYVEKYNARNFPFHDLTAILKRDWIIDFCNEIIARKLDISWQLPSGTRCEVVDDEVASLLFKSGGWSLNFAPESGSEAVRLKVKKQMKEESLFSAVEAAVKNKLNASCFFVLGFPGDRPEDMKATLQWAKRLAKSGIDDVAVGFFFPIPGTQFFRELQAIGKVELNEETMMAPIFVHDRWLTEGRNFSQTMSAKQLTLWRYRIVFAFYLRAVLLNPKRLWRLFSNFLKGNEDSKLDSFLQILKQRFFTKRAVKGA
ncbi:MAG: B12-binding domain-containing radical SAM protein [Planctomycetes bacterium]|nr:B12-binding domain-containing radical SAM protein [Planctomycetota bacterium]